MKPSASSEAPGRTSSMPTWTDTSATRPPGLVPTRASGDGSLPVSGADDAHEWTGYIPFEQMPSVFDPPSGIFATANGRITPDAYPYSISTQWGSPYRTERINHVLRANRKFTAADMLALQTDIYSEFDKFTPSDSSTLSIIHQGITARQGRSRCHAQVGWPHHPRFRRRHHQSVLPPKTHGPVARRKARHHDVPSSTTGSWRQCGWSRSCRISLRDGCRRTTTITVNCSLPP